MSNSEVDKPSAQRVRSVLQHDLILEGSIAGKGILEVDGKIIGDIDVDTVVAASNSVIHGDIRSRNLTIFGQITGSVDCEALVLKETANLNSERIQCGSLSIENEAWITGLSVCVKAPTGAK